MGAVFESTAGKPAQLRKRGLRRSSPSASQDPGARRGYTRAGCHEPGQTNPNP